MPSSQNWSQPDDDSYADDEGNIIYYDKRGRLRKFNHNDREYQQMYHYSEDDH